MSQHRYWRVFVQGRSSTFALSELALADAALPRPGELTSSRPPVAGSLTALRDGLATEVATFSAGTFFDFDLGIATEVNNLILGAPVSEAVFPSAFRVDSSDDGVTWATDQKIYGPVFPGPLVFCQNRDTNHWSRVLSSYAVRLSEDETVAYARYAVAAAVGAFTGRRQVEFLFSGPVIVGNQFVGFVDDFARTRYSEDPVGASVGGYSWRPNGELYSAGVISAYSGPWTEADTLGAVFDFDAGTIEYFKNGVNQGVAFSGLLSPGFRYPAIFNNNTQVASGIRLHDFTHPVADARSWAPSVVVAKTDFSAREIEVSRTPNAAAMRLGFVQTREHMPTRQGGAPFGQDYGRGFIHSTVKRDGDPIDLPMRRKVRLMRERDGRVVGETWSDAATGAYEFNYIDPAERYTVLAYDHEHNFRAVVADNLTPSVAP